MNLVLHPATKQQISHFAASPSHAVLLTGPAGSGKYSLAVQLAETILELPAGAFDDHPYSLVIAPVDGKAIGIEAVRQLEQFLSLKVPDRRQSYDRAVIIENASEMSLEAQNALLKTLEEPPTGTLLILTADNVQALLPTIRSRAQVISVTQPAGPDLEAYFGDRDGFSQALAVSAGRPGLLKELLDEDDHPLKQATAMARQLLSQSVYDRLCQVDGLAKNRQLATDTAFILGQMAHISLRTASGPAAQRWQRVLETSYLASQALAGNAQPKLALTNLMLNL